MQPQQPAYPFYTRFGDHAEDTQFAAWISDSVVIRVNRPLLYSHDARIDANQQRHVSEKPQLESYDKHALVDVLVTRDEFMAAYNDAEAFIQAAAREFLPAKAIDYITRAQSEEIVRLLNHPAFNRAAKSKWLLRINRLTKQDADAAIKVLTDTRAMFDGPDLVGEYKVSGEVILIPSVAA